MVRPPSQRVNERTTSDNLRDSDSRIREESDDLRPKLSERDLRAAARRRPPIAMEIANSGIVANITA